MASSSTPSVHSSLSSALHKHIAAATARPSSLLPTEGSFDRCIELPVDPLALYQANLAHNYKVKELMSRPARKQVENPAAFTSAYTEGQEGYNIWYHKFASRPGEYGVTPAKDPAETTCVPSTDVGYTRADKIADHQGQYYCYYFAKGCCGMGEKCQFRHKVPTEEDELTLEASRDVFGREKHADHRDDMGGTGTFEADCRTLYIGRIHVDRTRPEFDSKHLLDVVASTFSQWGPIENLRILPRKGLAFITYMLRVSAEFAKVAMSDQSLGNCGAVINVRWAHEMSKEAKERMAARAAMKPLPLPSAPPTEIRKTQPDGITTTLGKAGTADEEYLDMYFKSLQQQQQSGTAVASGGSSGVIGPFTPQQLEDQQKQKEATNIASRMQNILSGIDTSTSSTTDPFKVIM
eukprot:GHVS01042674.1.p1 GENE.GHVS01042674.1~~GHVS01042674.1.p1  ORF type:complete len:407 (-),score=65.70 GHVS01042674.1:63-1283(-)